MEVLSWWSAKENESMKATDSEIENTLMKAGEAVIRSLCCLVMKWRSELVKLYSDVTDWRILFVSGRRPTIGGKYCLGERKRFRSCNIDVSITAFHQSPLSLINLMWPQSWILLNFICFVCCHWMVSCLHMFVMHMYMCMCVCVCVCVCLRVTGVRCRFSGFPGDPVLWLWQRSFPGEVLHLEAIQRGWVNNRSLCVVYRVVHYICRPGSTRFNSAWESGMAGICISTNTRLPTWRCVLNQCHACPNPCRAVEESPLAQWLL